MRLDCDTTERNGVTLVTCRLRNDGDGPRRVRVESRLEGPVWFPRVGGVPARGWRDGGYEAVLAAGETRPVGYATPASPDPDGPPAAVVESESASGAHPENETTPTAAARSLPDARPPRAAVPDPEPHLPPSVAAWLSALERGDLRTADRRTLDAVARRIDALRERGDA